MYNAMANLTLLLITALKQSSRSLMATPLKDLLPSPTAESGPLISQRSSFRLASLLPWSHDHSHRAHLKAKVLHTRGQALHTSCTGVKVSHLQTHTLADQGRVS